MAETNTGWMHATTDVNEALAGLMSCLDAGLNAWIEARDNGDQDLPVMKVNPELDDPFNWVMAYGTVRNEDEMKTHRYLNDTERDLTNNWTAGFGDPAAIKKYREDGEITEGLLKSAGVNFPIRIEDAVKYRAQFMKDGYTNYKYFVTYWKPKKNIRPYVVDDSVGRVFVVCYNKEPVDKKDAMRKAAGFLLACADDLEAREG